MLRQARSPNIAWIPANSFRWNAQAVLELVFGTAFPYPAIGRWSALAFVAVLLVWGARRLTRLQAIACLLVPLAFYAAVFLVSVARPLMVPRVMMWMNVPLSLAAAHLWLALPRGRARAGWLAALLAVHAAGTLAYYFRPTKEDWRSLSLRLAESARGDCRLVTGEGTQTFHVEHYAPGIAGKSAWHLRKTLGGPPNAELFLAGREVPTTDVDLAGLARLIADGRRTCLVMRDGDASEFAKSLATMPRPPDRVLKARGGLVADLWF
jgi:hypothetical protein